MRYGKRNSLDGRCSKRFFGDCLYLKENWPGNVTDRFHKTLLLKSRLLQKQPHLGSKSSKYSRFRKTLVTQYYMLIYSTTKDHIVIHRLKHTSMK